jgi:hypothetical protein
MQIQAWGVGRALTGDASADRPARPFAKSFLRLPLGTPLAKWPREFDGVGGPATAVDEIEQLLPCAGD